MKTAGQKIEQMDRILENLERLGWDVRGPYGDGGYTELERFTPAGEDWIVTLGVGPEAEDDELARQAYDAYMGFDIAEELQLLIDNRGLRGIPDDVFLLFADQIWKEIELDKLWQVARFGEFTGLDGLHIAAYEALMAIAQPPLKATRASR